VTAIRQEMVSGLPVTWEKHPGPAFASISRVAVIGVKSAEKVNSASS
jgi:hypothetical protein